MAAVFTVAAQVELLLVTASSGVPLGWALGNLMILPALALRRERPLLPALVAAAGFGTQLLTEGSLPVAVPFLGLLFLLASVGWQAPLRYGLIGTFAVLLGGLLPELARGVGPADVIVNAVIITGAWAAGHLLRRASDKRVRAEIASDRAAREAVMAERGRIARDLHDSMAHALTLTTLQAGSARERSTEVATGELLLGSIESTAREALAAMHRLLRVVGGQDERIRGIAALEDLVTAARGADLQVVLAVDLPEEVPGTLSTTVWRIVQEGLTNVVRHSGAGHALVGVAREDTGTVVVSVTDDGPGRPGRTEGAGRGLAGVRERVELLGGVIEAGPSREGWRLEARIPWESA